MKKPVLVMLGLILAVAVGVASCNTVSPIRPASPRAIQTPPASPSNLTTEAVPQGAVKLQWIDNSNNEAGFRIYRDNNLVATVGSNVSTYQDIGLKPGTTYIYTVRAYNATGESQGCSATMRTPNPPITVRLDGLGVFDNREPWVRGVGDVYVVIAVSDGNSSKEWRFPAREGECYSLDKNEAVDIGATIFSTNEVGDFLTIVAIGYESDGGPFEQLVYKALGAAVEAYVTGGVTGSLLEIYEFSLGGLLAKFFGAEDDWLGSFAQTWMQDSNWGVGKYRDIVCYDERGVKCLRLWFTIANR